ncbi:MAG: hypothetical protein JXR91_11705 [Deltaproteobacteria bacterium]|nr:hypothetical protein [Deltaproteobacteria bacterium]
MVASRGLNFIFFYLILLLFSYGCKPERGYEKSDIFSIFPPQTYISSTFIADFDFNGTVISNCPSIVRSNNSLRDDAADSILFEFAGEGDEGYGVKAQSLEIVSESVLRVVLSTSGNSATGSYQALFSCSSELLFESKFTVKSRVLSETVTLDPESMPAGTQYQQISVTLENQESSTLFKQGVTELIFGDAKEISVYNIQVSDDGLSLTAWISIATLALGSDEVSRLIDVKAITGISVSSGIFTITSQNFPKIEIAPSGVNRPAPGIDDENFSLKISAKNMDFTNDLFKNGILDNIDDFIFFPDNPGLSVTSVKVISESELICDVSVKITALQGPSSLVVKDGNNIAVTSFSVISGADDINISFDPLYIENCLSSNCAYRRVIAKSTGFIFSDLSTVTSLTEGVSVNEFNYISKNTMSVLIDTEPGFTGGSVTLEFVDGTSSVKSDLMVKDFGGFQLEKLSNQIQGVKNNLFVGLESGKINEPSLAFVPDNTGTFFETQYDVGGNTQDGTKEGIFIKNFQPLQDAPTGPAVITVGDSKESFAGYFNIESSGLLPYFDIEPETLWIKSLRNQLILKGNSSLFFDDDTKIEVSDPAISIESVAINSVENNAVVNLNFNKNISSGVKVLYVQNINSKAAASLIVTGTRLNFDANANNILYRSKGTGEISVTPLKDMGSYISASIYEGIGIGIERVYTSVGNIVKILFTLDETGPGGLIGVVLTGGGKKIVVPVYIDAADLDGSHDNSLTATLIPEQVVHGSSDVSLAVQIPQIISEKTDARFCLSTIDAVSPSMGVKVIAEDVQDICGNAAIIRADVSYDALPFSQFDGFPVLITAGRAAIGGIWKVNNEQSPVEHSLVIDGGLEFHAKDGRDVIIKTTFSDDSSTNKKLVMLRTSELSDDYTLFNANVLAQDMITPVSSSAGGLVFTFQKDDFYIAGKPDGDSFVSAKSMGEDGYIKKSGPACETPFLFIGFIKNAQDLKEIDFSNEGNCRMAAVVLARSLNDKVYETPDVHAYVCNDHNSCSEATAVVNNNDPSLYFDMDSTILKAYAGSWLGSVGYFMLNFRGPSVISSVSRQTDNQYIMLDMEPLTDLSLCKINRLDSDTGTVISTLQLIGNVPADGKVIISSDVAAGPAVLDDQSVSQFNFKEDFLIELECSGETADQFQVGGSYAGAEKPAAINGGFDCFKRIGGSLDTNENIYDITGSWSCSL